MTNQYDWAVIPNAESIETIVLGTNHTYDLVNLSVGEALMYQKRDWGIHLGFGDPSSSSNIKFQRKAGKTGSLQFGEMFAISVRNGRWLYYAKREYGINLNWSESPKYEWRFDSSDGKTGVIRTLAQVGLYSSVENDQVIYEIRDWGVNLKWFKDAGKYQRWQDLKKIGKTLKSMKDEVDGWIG